MRIRGYAVWIDELECNFLEDYGNDLAKLKYYIDDAIINFEIEEERICNTYTCYVVIAEQS